MKLLTVIEYLENGIEKRNMYYTECENWDRYVRFMREGFEYRKYRNKIESRKFEFSNNEFEIRRLERQTNKSGSLSYLHNVYVFNEHSDYFIPRCE